MVYSIFQTLWASRGYSNPETSNPNLTSQALPSSIYSYAQQWQDIPLDLGLTVYPLHSLLANTKSQGAESGMYNILVKASYRPLPLDTLWRMDGTSSQSLKWKVIWSNIILSSRNQNHQMIHYKLIHRACLSPRRLCQIKIRADPYCSFCTDDTIGTFIHMVFGKKSLLFSPHCWGDWSLYYETYFSSMIRPHWSSTYRADSSASLASLQRKRMVVRCWELELSCARLKASKPPNITCWAELLEKNLTFPWNCMNYQ